VLQSAVEIVRIRRTIHEMQARVMRGSTPPAFEAMVRQIAAELETPVAALAMNAEHVGDLLTAGLSSWQSPERAQELVEHARDAQRDSTPPLAQLKSIVRKLERGQRLSSSPPPLMSDAVRVVQATARILGPVLSSRTRLQLVMSGSPAVQMEAAELGQVLVNLITNASEALARLPDQAPSIITVSVSETNGSAQIAVTDSGPGIESDQLERIFDPYVTTRDEAVGLGLSVVRHLVTQAGGTIRAESRPGCGARFVVTLPRADQPAALVSMR
jgi:signal transduction histidine kinase